MAQFFSLMCSLGIPRGGGWVSQHCPCHSLALWKEQSICFRDSPSSPLRWRQQAEVPQFDPFRIPGTGRSSHSPAFRPSPLGWTRAVGVGWDPSQLHFLSSCPTRRNTKAERRKLDIKQGVSGSILISLIFLLTSKVRAICKGFNTAICRLLSGLLGFPTDTGLPFHLVNHNS